MPKDPVQPGKYFEYRPGINEFQRWRGMQLDSDPASLPPGSLALGLNIRFDGPNIVNRPGIREVIKLPDAYGTTGPGGITWLGHHHLQFHPPKLWLAGFGTDCNGGIVPGGSLLWFDPEANPPLYQGGQFEASNDFGLCIGLFGGEVHVAAKGNVYRVGLHNETLGEASVGVVPRQRGIGVATYGEEFAGIAMKEFDGKLFISLKDPAGTASKVATWDGLEMVLSDLSTTTTHGLNFCRWRDGKLVMVQDGTTTAKIRDLAGTWSNVTLPGAMSNWYQNSMVEFRDDIYIANGPDIYKLTNYNSPVASTVHTIASHTITSVAVMHDNLYYLYNSGTPDFDVFLGMFEPDIGVSNWRDGEVLLNDEFSPGTVLATGVAMIEFKGRLFVSCPAKLLTHSETMDVRSSWLMIYDGTTIPFQLIVG